MNDLDLLKKVKGAAPLDSPEFTGTPKVPTPSSTTSDTQIANAQFVSNKVVAIQELLSKDISDLSTRIDNLGDVQIDSDALKEEIKADLETTLSEDIIKELEDQSIEISYKDLESRQKSVLEQVDSTLELLTTAITEIGEDKTPSLVVYKANLENQRASLVTEYDLAKAAYDVCCTNNTTENYADFTQKLDNWYVSSGKILGYCQSALNAIDRELLGYKADATQEAIFNLLTNNGEAQGIYKAEVTDEDGNTTTQLFINGEYAQLYGLTVKDLNNTDTFKVSKSGDVSINAYEFSLKGKSIDDTVSEAIANDTTINDAINSATGGLTTTIDNLSSKVDTIESQMGNVSTTVKEAIADEIITDAEVASIGRLYNDIATRQSAVLDEIDAVLALTDISDNDKDLLTTYRTSVVNTFTTVTTTYTTLTTNKTVESFTAFDTAVKNLNEAVGTARAHCQTTQDNISTIKMNTRVAANRKAVFDTLTDEGKIQGIQMVTVTDEETGIEETQLYINGEYIRSEDFAANNSITTPELYVEKINSVRVPTMLTSTCSVTVNPSSADADDNADFKDGAIYKTLQGAIYACPVIFNGESVYIRLESDITEDIEIRGKTGGSLYIYLQGHSIYGTIKIWDCHSVLIYGGTTYSEDLDIADRPAISPYELNVYDTYYYTIIATRTSYVYIKNINIYNKVTTDSNLIKKYYNIGASRGTTMNVYNVGIGNSTNGFQSIRGANIIAQNTAGLASRYGFEARYGGEINICTGSVLSNNASAGGSTANTYSFNNETINIADGIVFATSELSATATVPTESSTTSYSLSSSTGYSYRISGTYIGTWASKNVVRQGKWDYTSGMNMGFWFFENLFDYYANLNITKLEITIIRQAAGSYGSAASMKLRWHTYRYQVHATNSVKRTDEGPIIESDWYYDVPIQSLNDGATNTFIIDASNSKDTTTGTDLSGKGPITAIKEGYLKGFCIYDPSGTYQQYSPTMKVTIYCN